jgi:N-acetylmuramoyl-L-alanine amidase
MFKKILPILVFALSLAALSSFSKKGVQRPVIRTIVVDAGHGGYDVGAKGLFSTEADVSLAIAMKLGKRLETEFPECKIVYTRTNKELPGNLDDLNAANHLRAEMANEAKGDLFISIHCNSAGLRAGGWNAKRIVGYNTKKVVVGKGKKKRTRIVKTPIMETYYVKNEVAGTETFIWAADRSSIKSGFINPEEPTATTDSSAEAATDNNIIMPDMNSPEFRIRSQLYEKKYFTKSLMLAGFVEEELVNAGRSSRGVKQRNDKGIWVLQATGMPSILVETGFISNEEEEVLINSEQGQEDLVQSIVKALKRYKEAISSRS